MTKVTLLEEIKQGKFKLKKPEEKKADKGVKAKEENKTFVVFMCDPGRPSPRECATQMGVRQQTCGS